MTDINQQQFDQLVYTLDNLPLEEPQRALLDGILRVAADITEQTDEDEELAFASEFSHSFTKAKADLVLEYVAATQGTGHHMITRSVTSPPSIIRTPPTPPNPHDEN
jgi:hypothetical protein